MSNRPEDARKCVNCNEKKPRWQFGRDSRRRDGLKSWCRECEREWAKAHYRDVVKPRRAKK